MVKYTFAQTAKTWKSLIGSILTLVIPYLLQISPSFPAPWPAVIGAVLAVLTAFGVYKVPNAPGTRNRPVSGGTVGQNPVFPESPWPKY